MINALELREYSYLAALRHLEETARIQKLVYYKQLADINVKVRKDQEAERDQIIKDHPINNPTKPSARPPLYKRKLTV